MMSKPLKTPVTLVMVGTYMVKELAAKIKNGFIENLLFFPPQHPAGRNTPQDFT